MVSVLDHLRTTLRRPESLALIAILLLASFLRLYRLDETVVFQSDQGRDAIIVKELIKDSDVKLIGPVTSVGNMYLGPLYYYFMAPFLWLTYPSPMGPVIAVAVLNVVAVGLVYMLGSRMFDPRVGLLAAGLLAVMEPAVFLSRFSWNPNLMGLLGLMIVGLTRLAWQKKDSRWLMLAWLVFAAIIQLHYVALLMGGWLAVMSLYWYRQRPKQRKALILHSIIGFFIVSFSFAPLVVFDWAHEHRISQGFAGFFTSDEHHLRSPLELLKIVWQVEGRSLHVLAQLLQWPEDPWQLGERALAYGLIGFMVYLWRKGVLKKYQRIDLLMLGAWLVITVVGTAFYTSSVFDHYIIFVYPAVALLYGLAFYHLWQLAPVGRLIGLGVAAVILVTNLHQTPVLSVGGPPLAQFGDTARVTLPYVVGMKYNVLLISDNLDHKGLNYRYFFVVSDQPPAGIDDFEGLDRLVLIDDKLSGKPFDHGIYELEKVNFREIEMQFRVDNGPMVYILKQEE